MLGQQRLSDDCFRWVGCVACSGSWNGRLDTCRSGRLDGWWCSARTGGARDLVWIEVVLVVVVVVVVRRQRQSRDAGEAERRD